MAAIVWQPGMDREPTFPKQCRPCQPGFFNDDGLGTCTPCPRGFATDNTTGNTDCRFCPDGLTTLASGSTLNQCISPLAAGKAALVSTDTWINMGVGAAAALAVLGTTMLYAKRRSSSLLHALETVTRSTLPNIIAFWLELSDLGSDVACALGLLAIDLAGISSTLVVVYVGCVCAHIIPSGYNLFTRGSNLVHELRLSVKSRVMASEATATPTPSTATTAVMPADRTKPTTAAEPPMYSVLQTLAKERTHLEQGLSAARLRQRGMLAVLIGLVFEDLAMSIINCAVFWIAKDHYEARNHHFFGVLGLAAVSSLLNLGFKVARVEHWLLRDRPVAKQTAERLRLLQNYIPTLQRTETLDGAAAAVTQPSNWVCARPAGNVRGHQPA